MIEPHNGNLLRNIDEDMSWVGHRFPVVKFSDVPHKRCDQMQIFHADVQVHNDGERLGRWEWRMDEDDKATFAWIR